MNKIKVRLISLLVIYGVFSTVITHSAKDPCVNYTLNKEVARTTNSTSDAPCTTKPSPGRWYRFDNDTAGQITMQCPSNNVCGNGPKIWINGTVPQISDGEVNVTACVIRTSRCCPIRQSIAMKACNGYFVYNIKVPLCTTVCIDEDAEKPIVATTTITTPTTNLITTLGNDPCIKYKNLTNWFSLKNSNDTCNTSQPTNTFQQPEWFRFTSTVTGQLMNTCPEWNQCGSKYATWINGSYVEDSLGVSSITLCVRTDKSCCERALHSLFVYCNGFLVYFLTPPIAGSTYCLDNTVDIELSKTSSTQSSTPTTTETTATTFLISTTTPITTTKTNTKLTTSTSTTSSTQTAITAPTSKITKQTTTSRTTTWTTTTTSSSTPTATTPTILTTSTSSSDTETTTSKRFSSPTKLSEQISTGASTETITTGRSKAFPSTGLISTAESQSSEAPAEKSGSKISTEFIVAIVCTCIIVFGFVIATIIVKARSS